jgi:hypothetical protein
MRSSFKPDVIDIDDIWNGPGQEAGTAAVTALHAAVRICVTDELARAVTLCVEAARPTT